MTTNRSRRTLALASALFAVAAVATISTAARAQDSGPVAHANTVAAPSTDSVYTLHASQTPELSLLKRVALRTATIALLGGAKVLDLTAAGFNAATRTVDAGSCSDGLPISNLCERYIASEAERIASRVNLPSLNPPAVAPIDTSSNLLQPTLAEKSAWLRAHPIIR